MESLDGDTIIRIAAENKAPIELLILAKVECVKTRASHIKNDISINALKTAENFGLGKINLDDLNISMLKACRVYYESIDPNKPYPWLEGAVYAASNPSMMYSAVLSTSLSNNLELNHKKQMINICKEILSEYLNK